MVKEPEAYSSNHNILPILWGGGVPYYRCSRMGQKTPYSNYSGSYSTASSEYSSLCYCFSLSTASAIVLRPVVLDDACFPGHAPALCALSCSSTSLRVSKSQTANSPRCELRVRVRGFRVLGLEGLGV